MTLDRVRQAQWSQLSEYVAENIGLHFPPERWDDLRRGLAGAAQEFGFEDAAACIAWLTSTQPTKAHLEVLAGHLTVGETYFFRDKQMLAALAQDILPAIIRNRRGKQQRLRIWSAACCTGEEPYSLAILLHQALPDLRDWHVTITATDINSRFLRTAAAGVYRDWSFRDAPAWLKQRYFERTEDGRYAIVPEIRNLVTFAHLNLVEDAYPSLATDTNAVDLILCRNVLMYFAPAQVRRVIGNLHRCLVEGGWLAVSPSEASKALFPEFSAVNFPGAIFFQKSSTVPRTDTPVQSSAKTSRVDVDAPEYFRSWEPAVGSAVEQELVAARHEHASGGTSSERIQFAQALYTEGRYAEAIDTLLPVVAERTIAPTAYSLLTRALANLGQLTEALSWCERWLATDKMDPAAHYLRAIVLLEQGDADQARAALQRAVYLDHDLALGHFALGNLARARGRRSEAQKHFDNALRLLKRCQPGDLVPESDGLTAGRLIETITSLTEATP